MKNSLYIFLLALLFNQGTPFARAFELSDELPVDPAVRSGQLENGLRYFLRPNAKPEKRVELRLVIRAGSVLETDEQQGLAHFLEHMAFNGTQHFKKSELVDYLEGIGMSFGADLNAYTSFDETVYMLQLPSDDPEKVAKGLLILRDWADGLLLEQEEIDKERGVVIEEWRGRRGARQRIMDQFLPAIFHGARYAERLPIGKVAVLESFTRDQLQAFYDAWYRPELMSVIAVGDLDMEALEKQIRTQFASVKNRGQNPERVWFDVPAHDETIVKTADDPELSTGSLSVYFKRAPSSDRTVTDYRRSMMESLFFDMFNDRLNEISQKSDAPFLGAGAGNGRFVHGAEFTSLGGRPKENGHEEALQALVTEVERVRRNGFTESELARARKNTLRGVQSMYQERDKMESGLFASALVQHVVQEASFTAVETDLKLHEQLLDGITLAEVNALAASLFSEKNRVVLADGPRREGARLPAPEALLKVYTTVQSQEIAAYQDDVADQPLLAQVPKGGTIERVQEIPELGLREVLLSNGIRLILKPTDFKQDQILFTAFSPGGHSLADDARFIPATSADSVVAGSGWGTFNLIQLRKMLSGRIASVSPYISELEEGLNGGCSPDDVSTLFELIHLAFTAPRLDDEAIASMKQRMEVGLANRLASPGAWYGDRVTEIMTSHHPRYAPWTVETLKKMNPKASLTFYKERFADADDFTFIFVGNFDPDQLSSLAAQYLGGLPRKEGAETFKDVGSRIMPGRQWHVVEKGLEPKSNVRIVYHGPFEWNFQNRHHLLSLGEALNIRLREEIREARSGVYSISASPSRNLYPRPEYQLTISFGCDPERVPELIEAVDDLVASFRTKAPGRQIMQKIHESQLRQRETDLKTNGFWLGVLKFYLSHGEDPLELLKFEEEVNSLKAADILQAAKTYLNEEERAVFILRPETTGK